jgi:hypothetical protein
MHRISQISIGDCQAMGGNVPLRPSRTTAGDYEPAPDAAPAYRDQSRNAHLPDRGTPARRLLQQASMLLIAGGAADLVHADLRPLVRPLAVSLSLKEAKREPFPEYHASSVRTHGRRIIPRRFESSRKLTRRWPPITDREALWFHPPSRTARTVRGDVLLETPDGLRVLLTPRAH